MNPPRVVGIISSLALALAIWSVWVRRDAWRCRGEALPTVMVIATSGAALLTSPRASRLLGPGLHRITGRWNVEDLIGHSLAVIGVSALVYMVLNEFGDDRTLRILFERHVILPLTVLWPLMFATFVDSIGTQYNTELDLLDAGNDPWLQIYWTLLCGTLIYLLRYAAIGLVIMRREAPSLVVFMYLATVNGTIIFLIALFSDVTTPLEIHNLVWMIGYTCAAGWAATPAISWLRKSRPLREARMILRDEVQRSRESQ